ncbi:MAG: endonuclease domain-containing protein [Alphaproteobacteria bacterium]|nr:endonuclease domain-containing protein [Alphaproteobacteria bacterium]
MKLPKNKSLQANARNLRKNSTLAEVLLWNLIKNKRVNGLDFDRQKIIGNYIVDFYCAKLNLVIEIDGNSHDNKYIYDKKRDTYLESLGLHVIHFDDHDVKLNIDKVIFSIEEYIKCHYPTLTGTPSPAKGITNH